MEATLKEFSISVEGKICVDIGASICGFADCLLKHDASNVYIVDTATDLLHQSLKNEETKEKIIPMFGVDARKLISIGEKLDIYTVDVTFASITQILPNVKGIIKKNGNIIRIICYIVIS